MFDLWEWEVLLWIQMRARSRKKTSIQYISYERHRHRAYLINCLRICDKLIQTIPINWQFSTDNRSKTIGVCHIHFGTNRYNDSGDTHKNNFQIHCFPLQRTQELWIVSCFWFCKSYNCNLSRIYTVTILAHNQSNYECRYISALNWHIQYRCLTQFDAVLASLSHSSSLFFRPAALLIPIAPNFVKTPANLHRIKVRAAEEMKTSVFVSNIACRWHDISHRFEWTNGWANQLFHHFVTHYTVFVCQSSCFLFIYFLRAVLGFVVVFFSGTQLNGFARIERGGKHSFGDSRRFVRVSIFHFCFDFFLHLSLPNAVHSIIRN